MAAKPKIIKNPLWHSLSFTWSYCFFGACSKKQWGGGVKYNNSTKISQFHLALLGFFPLSLQRCKNVRRAISEGQAKKRWFKLITFQFLFNPKILNPKMFHNVVGFLPETRLLVTPLKQTSLVAFSLIYNCFSSLPNIGLLKQIRWKSLKSRRLWKSSSNEDLNHCHIETDTYEFSMFSWTSQPKKSTSQNLYPPQILMTFILLPPSQHQGVSLKTWPKISIPNPPPSNIKSPFIWIYSATYNGFTKAIGSGYKNHVFEATFRVKGKPKEEFFQRSEVLVGTGWWLHIV